MQRTVSRSPFFAGNALLFGSSLGQLGPISLCLLGIATLMMAGHRLGASTETDNVLLDFTATWCGPCQQMSSIVSRLERQGYPIRKVDVDQEPELAAKYHVESIPTFILVSNGREVKRANGLTSEQQLVGMLKLLDKRPAEKVAAAPRQKKESGPRLGIGIPLTPPEDSKPPRARPLPVEPTQPPPAENFAFADASDDLVYRGNNPDVNPQSASVRIRVKDGTSVNFGSGTIIDSQPGRATILTCGHIFRKLSKNAVIEVDVYNGPKAKPDTVPGRVLLTDLEADLGLVNISFPSRLPTMPLGLSRPLSISEKLFSIGCSGGDNPSRENLELTAINKYRGPDNLECTTRPQKGRSGGGLFRDEELVGVCIAADPDKPLGLYTGLQPIGLLLEKAGLTHVAVRSPKVQPAVATNPPPRTTSADAATPFQLASTESDISRVLDSAASVAGAAAPSAVPQDFAGAEVICIVRSKVPGKPSRVVIVNQASDRFVADLLHESTGETTRQPDVKTAHRTAPANPQGPVETSLELRMDRRSTGKCDPKTGACPLPEPRFKNLPKFQ